MHQRSDHAAQPLLASIAEALGALVPEPLRIVAGERSLALLRTVGSGSDLVAAVYFSAGWAASPDELAGQLELKLESLQDEVEMTSHEQWPIAGSASRPYVHIIDGIADIRWHGGGRELCLGTFALPSATEA